MKKLISSIIAVLSLLFVVVSCTTDADVASHNLSKAADQFQIARRIVFYNGITDAYMLTIQGLCSLGNWDSAKELTVTCKTEKGFKKHFLGLSDNVTYFVEQLNDEPVSTYQYKVIFKPTTIIPDINVR